MFFGNSFDINFKEIIVIYGGFMVRYLIITYGLQKI